MSEVTSMTTAARLDGLPAGRLVEDDPAWAKAVPEVFSHDVALTELLADIVEGRSRMEGVVPDRLRSPL